ncbi:MAG TPA: hypothetical protein VMQ62_12570, partial [Dongiaceae bacterium]|nr:hypothetical protein [Dongiaceae bacterium]
CLFGSRSRLAQVAVGLSPLVRPELALAWLLVVGWIAWTRRRPPWIIVTSGVVANGAWLLFRAIYYADLFPTTFYLKCRTSPIQGLIYLHDTFGPYQLYLWLTFGLLALYLARSAGWEERAVTRTRFALLAVAFVMTAYVVAIGGDARHFRYLAFPVLLGAFAFGGLVEGQYRAWGWRPVPYLPALVGVGLALMAAGGHPRQVSEIPLYHLLPPGGGPPPDLAIVDGIADADLHRFHAELPPLSPWSAGDAIEMRPNYEAWRRDGGVDPPRSVNAEYLCWFHYRHFDEWSVHGFGLTDVVLARSRGDARPDDRPGHRMALLDRSREEAAILSRAGLPPRAGVYRAAVEAGAAPAWVRANLPVIELLEKKIYGPRDAWESLRLATHVAERVDLDAAPC